MEGRIEEITYTLKKSSRTRRMKISVSCEGKVSVTVPSRLKWGYLEVQPPSKMIEDFIKEKSEWIRKTLDKFATLPIWQKKKYTKKDYLDNKERVRILILSRLEHFYGLYIDLGVKFPRWKKIAIRNQKTRWGSCSKQANLNFNFKILWLPADLQDYIIVHELCHLKEFNHSVRFWSLVGKTIPEYNKLRKQLRRGII